MSQLHGLRRGTMPRVATRSALLFQIAACGLVWLALPRTGTAANKVWNTGNGNWTVGSNWSPVGVPTTGDDVFLTTVSPTNKTVTYQNNTLFLQEFNSMLMDSSGVGMIALVQTGSLTTLSSLTLKIGGVGTTSYEMQAGDTLLGAATLNSVSTLTVASGAVFRADNFTHNGTVYGGGSFTIPGTYTFNGGFNSLNGPTNTLASAGTFINNGGTFDGSVDANRLIVNGSGTFNGFVTNRSSLSVPAAQNIFVDNEFDQIGGTVFQSGNFGGTAPTTLGSHFTVINLGGGAGWTQNAGRLQGAGLSVGAGNGGPASYSLFGTGSINISNISIGAVSDGTFLQSGGLIQGAALGIASPVGFSRGPGPDSPPQRGFFSITDGTVALTGGMIVGGIDAVSATYLQSGGSFSAGGILLINSDSTTSASVNISGGSFAVANRSVSNGTFNVTGGSAAINDDLDGAGTVNVGGNGQLTVARLRQRAVSVSGNGLLRITKNAFLGGSGDLPPSTTSRVESLAFQQAGSTISGKLDLANNRLVIDYTGASPIDTIRPYIASGYANGSWDGTGINSAVAARDHTKAIGCAEASAVLGPSGGLFHGLLVDGSAVLVEFTYAGDASLDGQVDISDLGKLATNWQTSSNWTGGDFNNDGFVDISDLGMLATNWQAGVGNPLEPSFEESLASLGLPGTSVPEPSMALLLTATLILSRRRGLVW